MSSPLPTYKQHTMDPAQVQFPAHLSEQSPQTQTTPNTPALANTDAQIAQSNDVRAQNIPPEIPPLADTSSFERWVQSALTAVATAYPHIPCALPITGDLKTPETLAAIRAFQSNAIYLPNGRFLTPDGLLGPATTSTLVRVTQSTQPTLSERKLKAQQAQQAAAAPAPAQGGSEPLTESAASPTPAQPQAAAKIKRPGNAGKADDIRDRFPQGILASLTIPRAYDTDEAAQEKIQTAKEVDPYAYAVIFPQWAQSNPAEINAVWRVIRPQNSPLAPLFEANNPTQQKTILKQIQGNKTHWPQIQEKIFAAHTPQLKTLTFKNNRHIPDSAGTFAKAQGAVSAQSGEVVVGEAMIYKKKEEIPALVNATAQAVAQLLQNNPAPDATPEQATQDQTTAKIRALTISAHGEGGWMGGHGQAKDAGFLTSHVSGLVGQMASALTSDVQVRLFACATAAKGDGQQKPGEEHAPGGMADAFREALHDNQKTDGGVVAHKESGETQFNRSTQFLSAKSKDGISSWSFLDVVGPDYVQDLLARYELPTTGARGQGNVKLLGAALQKFFGREAWMEDVSSLDALKQSARARWESQCPDAAALIAKVPGIKAAYKRPTR